MTRRDPRPIISKATLRRLADTRLDEARALHKAGCHHGAIYLAGYAVECWLKIAICNTLDWEELYDTFKQHDLMFLLRHSGLVRKIEGAPKVNGNFKKIIGMWFWDRGDELRYCDPKGYGEEEAEVFLRWVADEMEGVVPWLSGQVS